MCPLALPKFDYFFELPPLLHDAILSSRKRIDHCQNCQKHATREEPPLYTAWSPSGLQTAGLPWPVLALSSNNRKASFHQVPIP